MCVNYGEAGNKYIHLLKRANDQGLFHGQEDFTESVFAYHAYLCGDDDSLDAYLSKFEFYKVNPGLLLPAGRIRVIQWAAVESSRMNSEEMIMKTIKKDYLNFTKIAKHPDAFSSYLLYILRYLYKTERSQFALQIFKAFYPMGPTGITFWSSVVWNRMNIYLAAIYFENNYFEEARNTIDKVKPEWFDTFQYELDMQDYLRVKDLIGNIHN